ncbi:major capsid protein [Thalassospira aquimaris]|uniref:Phage capsid protein n=1 Tax=Thalassospira aquimaris TaxID=3037796 RepID=A0ABT6GHN6_9PROT|nr:hypothetical protein [Thalassospira sp. FZY0004]MDG4721591.1 hypothetical protein [Thalassospira sp. FZY0004]
MATIGSDLPTLLDLMKTRDPKGRTLKIIEQKAKWNDILMDAIYVECNNGTKHITSMSTGIPEPAFRKYNKGVQPSHGGQVQVEDTTAMMEDYGEVDAALARKHADEGAYRTQQAKRKLLGFNQKTSRYCFYGNTATEPEGFLGLAPRFDDLSAPSGANVVDAQGTGSENTSIWFVTWGEETCHLIYPENTVIGFQNKDLGEQTKEFSDGSMMQVLRDHFRQDIGLSVPDWRGVSRVANIDVGDLTKDAQSGADLIDYMIDAYYRLQNPEQASGKVAIYCNRTIQTFLHKQAMNGKNVNLTIENFEGKPVTKFLGYPIRRDDSLINAEGRVT